MNTVQQIGQATGVAVVTVAFDTRGSLSSPAEVLSGYEPALVTAAAISVLGAVAALGMARHRQAPRADEDSTPVAGVAEGAAA